MLLPRYADRLTGSVGEQRRPACPLQEHCCTLGEYFNTYEHIYLSFLVEFIFILTNLKQSTDKV